MKYLLRCVLIPVLLSWWTAPAAELAVEKELASDSGWRAAKWGESLSDLAKTFGSDFQEMKRSAKQRDAKVAIRGKLRTKLPMDGLEYEVKFGFNSSDKLNSVYLVCEKAKQGSFDQVRKRLDQLFGETQSQRST